MAEFPEMASDLPEKESVNIPLHLIENPFFGKPFITPYEALTSINILSENLCKHEIRKEIDERSN